MRLCMDISISSAIIIIAYAIDIIPYLILTIEIDMAESKKPREKRAMTSWIETLNETERGRLQMRRIYEGSSAFMGDIKTELNIFG